VHKKKGKIIMKKILIALAAVATAVVANAASIDWQITGRNAVKDSSGATFSGGQAYLIMANAADDIVAAYAGGTLSSTTAGVLDAATLSNNANLAAARTATSDSLTARSSGGSQYAYQVLLVQTVDGKNMYQLSSSMSDYAYAAGADDAVQVTFQGSTAFNTANWAEAKAPTTDVPEPTSGLLLLVGAAGLALRRKQK
jgi:hypothetical protein